MTDTTALVTGAGRGIGRAVALELARRGSKVALASRSRDQLEETAGLIQDEGGEALVLPTDLNDAASVAATVKAVAEKWDHIDVMVNNAGIMRQARIEDASVQDWDDIFTTNVRGLFLATQQALAVMGARGEGAIVNVGSYFGLKPVAGFSAYASSKAAVLQFTRVAALEAARRGVRVNAVAPGYVETDMTISALDVPDLRSRIEKSIPLGRVATTQEVAEVVAFLASAAARYITGEVILVDGGATLK